MKLRLPGANLRIIPANPRIIPVNPRFFRINPPLLSVQLADFSIFSAKTIKTLITPAKWLSKSEWPPVAKTEQTIYFFLGGGARSGFENSPAFQGWVSGNVMRPSPARDERKILPSLMGLGKFGNREPSHQWLGYFQPADGAGSGLVPTKPARGGAKRFHLFDHGHF